MGHAGSMPRWIDKNRPMGWREYNTVAKNGSLLQFVLEAFPQVVLLVYSLTFLWTCLRDSLRDFSLASLQAYSQTCVLACSLACILASVLALAGAANYSSKKRQPASFVADLHSELKIVPSDAEHGDEDVSSPKRQCP